MSPLSTGMRYKHDIVGVGVAGTAVLSTFYVLMKFSNGLQPHTNVLNCFQIQFQGEEKMTSDMVKECEERANAVQTLASSLDQRSKRYGLFFSS